jgi:hypothetical protein
MGELEDHGLATFVREDGLDEIDFGRSPVRHPQTGQICPATGLPAGIMMPRRTNPSRDNLPIMPAMKRGCGSAGFQDARYMSS